MKLFSRHQIPKRKRENVPRSAAVRMEKTLPRRKSLFQCQNQVASRLYGENCMTEWQSFGIEVSQAKPGIGTNY